MPLAPLSPSYMQASPQQLAAAELYEAEQTKYKPTMDENVLSPTDNDVILYEFLECLSHRFNRNHRSENYLKIEVKEEVKEEVKVEKEEVKEKVFDALGILDEYRIKNLILKENHVTLTQKPDQILVIYDDAYSLTVKPVFAKILSLDHVNSSSFTRYTVEDKTGIRIETKNHPSELYLVCKVQLYDTNFSWNASNFAPYICKPGKIRSYFIPIHDDLHELMVHGAMFIDEDGEKLNFNLQFNIRKCMLFNPSEDLLSKMLTEFEKSHFYNTHVKPKLKECMGYYLGNLRAVNEHIKDEKMKNIFGRHIKRLSSSSGLSSFLRFFKGKGGKKSSSTKKNKRRCSKSKSRYYCRSVRLKHRKNTARKR